MRLAALSACCALALGLALPALATNPTPAQVTAAIQKWDPKAQAVLDVEGKFAEILAAVPRAQVACEQPLGRGPLASALRQGLSPLISDTHFAEQGMLALYPLSKLFRTHAAKANYVEVLDGVGKQFDGLLKFSSLVQDVSNDISSGDCSGGLGLAAMDSATLRNTTRNLVNALTRLRLAYGV
jgi:hypothetical protein